MGYHLQPGGQFKGEFVVFRKSHFDNYDFEKPRTQLELRPVRTQEVSLTERPPRFMMKAAYDAARRLLKTNLLIRSDRPVADRGR